MIKLNNEAHLICCSYVFMAFLITFMLWFKLAWTGVAVVATFSSLQFTFTFFEKHFKSRLAHKLTLAGMVLFITIIVVLLSLFIYKAAHLGSSAINELTYSLTKIINEFSNYIPEEFREIFPDNVEEFKTLLTSKLKSNSSVIVVQTTTVFKSLIHIIIGIIIGALLAFDSFINLKTHKKLLNECIAKRAKIFLSVFNNVVVAQLKISFINTLLTSIFLLSILPIFNVHLPHSLLVIFLTFIFGMIPIVGNLLSNTIIIVLSLLSSFYVAVASLAFLVLIHKLEYYVNAKIVGSKINTKIWEMLIVMIIGETIFGITGLALSPIIYGYIKEELTYLDVI